jgi:Protein of unknown function (DUF998)
MTSLFGGHAALISGLATALVSGFTVGGTWWFGRRADGYSHRRDTISELGAAGTKDAKAVAWLWFAPSGLIFAVAAVALGQALGARQAGSILAFVGAGWVGAAIFPCDRGAPASGTVRNHLHNLAGGAAYLAGAAGLIEMGRALEHSHSVLSMIARVSGPLVLLGLFFISAPGLPVRGLIQRLMETILHGWLLVAAMVVLLS